MQNNCFLARTPWWFWSFWLRDLRGHVHPDSPSVSEAVLLEDVRDWTGPHAVGCGP